MKIRSEITTTHRLDVVQGIIWNKLIAFGGTEKFVPDLIEKVDLHGHGIGAVRTIHLKGGGVIKEELTKIDTKHHLLEFIIHSTPMPITEYIGIFQVSHVSEQQCEVRFSSIYHVLPENKLDMESVIKGFQETFTSNLDK